MKFLVYKDAEYFIFDDLGLALEHCLQNDMRIGGYGYTNQDIQRLISKKIKLYH